MAEQGIGTRCVQAGYTPGNGEPRQIPIVQSTTFKYATSEDMGKLFDLEASGYFYTRLQNPTNDYVAAKLAALEGGTAFAYAINNLQDRGRFFIEPQTEVYAGQVVGEHIHENDLVINVTKNKQLTNMRASGSDEKVRIIPATLLSLEEALEYIKEDEYVEVTPKSMRMRKIILDHLERKRAGRE